MFFRKKKQKRDREAGLVFHWRGARKHHLGKFIALVLAVSLFAFIAYGVKVEGLQPPLLSKRTGSVVFLKPDDPATRKLMFEIEEKSPFPARWDPAHDAGTRARVSMMLEDAVGEPWEYDAELVPVPTGVEQGRGELASIVDTRAGLLSGMEYGWRQDPVRVEVPRAGDLYVRAQVSATDDLIGRLPVEELNLPANLVAEDWFGQSFRFMVGVDARGVVRHCVPLPGGSMGVAKAGDRQKELGVWLRGQLFKPVPDGGGKKNADGGPDGLSFGELRLRIDATRE